MPERGIAVRVTQRDLATVVVEAARHVAGGQGDIVWAGPWGELLVRPSTVTATCVPGRVAPRMEVARDHVPKGWVGSRPRSWSARAWA